MQIWFTGWFWSRVGFRFGLRLQVRMEVWVLFRVQCWSWSQLWVSVGVGVQKTSLSTSAVHCQGWLVGEPASISAKGNRTSKRFLWNPLHWTMQYGLLAEQLRNKTQQNSKKISNYSTFFHGTLITAGFGKRGSPSGKGRKWHVLSTWWLLFTGPSAGRLVIGLRSQPPSTLLGPSQALSLSLLYVLNIIYLFISI